MSDTNIENQISNTELNNNLPETQPETKKDENIKKTFTNIKPQKKPYTFTFDLPIEQTYINIKKENIKRKPSRPFVTRKVLLNSVLGQRLIKKHLPSIELNIYLITSLSGTMINNYEKQQELSEAIKKIILNNADTLNSLLISIKTRLDEEGIDENSIEYSEPANFTVRLSTSAANDVITLIKRVDQVIRLYDAALICGIINDREYYSVNRSLINIFNSLRSAIGKFVMTFFNKLKEINNTEIIDEVIKNATDNFNIQAATEKGQVEKIIKDLLNE